MTKALKVAVLSSVLLIGACSNIATQLSSGPVNEDPTSRSLGEKLDDRLLRTKASINLKAEPSLADTNIEVYSYEGKIILIGQVQRQSQLGAAEKALNPLRDLKSIKNLLAVSENVSFTRSMRDGLLDTKIKAKLLANNQDSLSNVKVVVENGEAYLYGLATRKQANLATDLAKETKGIRSVIKIFSYID